MMRFRPCIDLRHGRVVQIVGASLRDGDAAGTVLNFEPEQAASVYAQMYKDDALPGGHVIALGPGNQEAALTAMHTFPSGMHMGSSITPEHALQYLETGASHVMVTSYVCNTDALIWRVYTSWCRP